MKAISMSPRSGQRTASSSAVVFLHGHQLERNVARAVTAEAADLVATTAENARVRRTATGDLPAPAAAVAKLRPRPARILPEE